MRPHTCVEPPNLSGLLGQLRPSRIQPVSLRLGLIQLHQCSRQARRIHRHGRIFNCLSSFLQPIFRSLFSASAIINLPKPLLR